MQNRSTWKLNSRLLSLLCQITDVTDWLERTYFWKVSCRNGTTFHLGVNRAAAWTLSRTRLRTLGKMAVAGAAHAWSLPAKIRIAFVSSAAASDATKWTDRQNFSSGFFFSNGRCPCHPRGGFHLLMNRRCVAFRTAMLRSTDPAPQSLTRPARPETKASPDLESALKGNGRWAIALVHLEKRSLTGHWQAASPTGPCWLLTSTKSTSHSLIHPTGDFRKDSCFALLSRHCRNSSTDGAALSLKVPDPLRARCASLCSCRTSVVFLPRVLPLLNTPSNTLQTLQNACASAGVLELADGDSDTMLLTLTSTEVEAVRSEITRLLSTTIGLLPWQPIKIGCPLLQHRGGRRHCCLSDKTIICSQLTDWQL